MSERNQSELPQVLLFLHLCANHIAAHTLKKMAFHAPTALVARTVILTIHRNHTLVMNQHLCEPFAQGMIHFHKSGVGYHSYKALDTVQLN